MKYDNILKCLPPTMVIAAVGKNDGIIHYVSDDELAIESVDEINKGSSLIISVYDFNDSEYKDYNFTITKICKQEKQAYSTVSIVSLTGDFDCFYKHIENISVLFSEENNNIGSIQAHIKDKRCFSNYPYDKDNVFCENFDELKMLWCSKADADQEYQSILANIEMAYLIVNYYEYENILKHGCVNTINDYFIQNHIERTGIFSKCFSRIYMGNEFCHNMLPDKDIFVAVIEKCIAEGFNITIAFPYLIERKIQYTDALLCVINCIATKHKTKIEIIINDWGMIELVKKYRNLCLVLGRLLNKRKKDPRIYYLWQYEKNNKFLAKNYLNNDNFIEFCDELGIDRYEFEDHLSDNELVNRKCSLHFPFYQINTSVFCPMYAQCKNYNKHKQNLILECPKYCENYFYLYSNHLNMFGRGNSIFGINNKIMTDKEYLKNYISKGIDRLVYSAY